MGENMNRKTHNLGEIVMNEYEKFQEWLNNCPVKIIHYEDLTDTFEVIFEVPLEDEEEK